MRTDDVGERFEGGAYELRPTSGYKEEAPFDRLM